MDKTELQMSAEKQQQDEHQGLKIVQGPILAPAQVGPKGNGCHGSDGWRPGSRRTHGSGALSVRRAQPAWG